MCTVIITIITHTFIQEYLAIVNGRYDNWPRIKTILIRNKFFSKD